jgi:type II secretory pathway component GspD/PulD (secretin)
MRARASRIRGAVAAMAATLALAGPAFAQDAGTAAVAAKAESATATSGTCTFDVIDQPIDKVLEYVRRASGTNIVVAQEAMNDRVTLAVRSMGWRSALEEIARRAGCTVEEMADYLRVEKPPRVSFSFEQADISKVIRTIAALSSANIVADPDDVKGVVTVNLIDIPWKKALSSIVGSKGYQVVEDPGGILRVVSANKLKAEVETRVYQLKFLRPPPDFAPKLANSQYVERTNPRMAGEVEKTFNIITSLREALKPEGTLEYINASNSLVLKGTKPKLAQVEKMLMALDREPMQIFVDMQFVSTSNTDLFNVGIGPGPNGIQGSMSLAKLENVVRLPFNIGTGGFEEWVSTRPDVPVASRLAAPTFSGGTLDFSSTSILLNLLKTDTKSRITQAPKLFVLDHQEATIFVGESIRYAETEAASSQSGTLQFSIKEATNSPVSTGFQLLFVPHVVPDSDKIIITIVPNQKSLTGTSTELKGFDKFSVGSGVGGQTIFLPREQSSTLVTTLICQNGITTVLGGLMTENNSETVTKIPWLGDIPFFGWLFKTESRGKQNSQLMIFMTPWLIKEASSQREALREDLMKRDRGLAAEWKALIEGTTTSGIQDKPPEKAPEKKAEPAPKPAEKAPEKK